MVESVAANLDFLGPVFFHGEANQHDATEQIHHKLSHIVSTDPPYYDNIGYAALSDYFYIWMRRAIGAFYPELFSTVLTPKNNELIAEPARHNSMKEASEFFEAGLFSFFENVRNVTSSDYPLTVFYAFRQSEINAANEIYSTGWQVFLNGLIQAGYQITATWPLRTEQSGGLRLVGRNALASSIVVSARPRNEEANITTRRDFLNILKREFPSALRTLKQGNIAPVDLAQAPIGPGMAIFSRYDKILEADGSAMSVRSALALINQILDEYLTEQEGEYDADTRWALAWFEQHGMDEGPFGVAETLSKAKNTAVDGLVGAGIIVSKAGKVRILRRDEILEDWDPATDKRLTVWEVTQHLIRAIVDKGSEEAAADLLKKVGALGDVARDLAYRLYTICDRKKWAQEALAYNSLVVAWPELVKLAGQQRVTRPTQEELFEKE